MIIKLALAAEKNVKNVGPVLGGIGPLGNVGSGDQVATGFSRLLSLVVGFMGLIAILWALYVIIASGYEWMSAAGDAQKISKAKQKITLTVVGILVAMGAVFLLALVSRILFGVNLLDLNSVIGKLQF